MTIAAFLPTLLLAFAQADVQDPVFVDRTLVIINDTVITFQDMVREAQRMTKNSTPNAYEQNYALQGLIRDAFFDIGFRKSVGSPAMLDSMAADEIRRMADSAGSLSKLGARLAQQGRTIAEETRRLRREYAGIYFMQVELGRLPGASGKVKANVNVSPLQLRACFEEHKSEFKHEARVRARLILLRDDERGSAEQRISELHQKISAGELDFAETARNISLYKPTIGGSTGHIRPTDQSLQQPIRDFLVSSTSKQLSKPIKLAVGWALVLAEDVQEAGFTPFKEAQLEIASILVGEQRRDLNQQALNRIAEQCYIWTAPELDGVIDAIIGVSPEEEL